MNNDFQKTLKANKTRKQVEYFWHTDMQHSHWHKKMISSTYTALIQMHSRTADEYFRIYGHKHTQSDKQCLCLRAEIWTTGFDPPGCSSPSFLVQQSSKVLQNNINRLIRFSPKKWESISTWAQDATQPMYNPSSKKVRSACKMCRKTTNSSFAS